MLGPFTTPTVLPRTTEPFEPSKIPLMYKATLHIIVSRDTVALASPCAAAEIPRAHDVRASILVFPLIPATRYLPHAPPLILPDVPPDSSAPVFCFTRRRMGRSTRTSSLDRSPRGWARNSHNRYRRPTTTMPTPSPTLAAPWLSLQVAAWETARETATEGPPRRLLPVPLPLLLLLPQALLSEHNNNNHGRRQRNNNSNSNKALRPCRP